MGVLSSVKVWPDIFFPSNRSISLILKNNKNIRYLWFNQIYIFCQFVMYPFNFKKSALTCPNNRSCGVLCFRDTFFDLVNVNNINILWMPPSLSELFMNGSVNAAFSNENLKLDF